MSPEARQVRLFSHHHHAVRLFHCRQYRFFIKWFQCTQINDFDTPTATLDDIHSRATGFQHHRTPGDDRNAARALTDTHTARLAYGERIIARRHIPILRHLRDAIALAIFRRLRAIQATTL